MFAIMDFKLQIYKIVLFLVTRQVVIPINWVRKLSSSVSASTSKY